MRGRKICDDPFTSRCIGCRSDFYGFVKSLSAYCGVKFMAVISFTKETPAKHLDIDDKHIYYIG